MPSELYEKTREMFYESDDYIYFNEFNSYFLDTMKKLANETPGELETYRLRTQYDSEMYYGIYFKPLRFQARNQFELWLKIREYIIENNTDKPCFSTVEKGYKYDERFYYDQSIANEVFLDSYTGDDHAAMVEAAKAIVDYWYNGRLDPVFIQKVL